MLDLTHFLIGTAWAQDAAGAGSPPGGTNTSMIMNFLPLVLIFLVFYALIIRPQQKKMDEQQRMIKALQVGDRVVTNGGIFGKVMKLEGDANLTIQIADGVNIRILRSSVSGLEDKATEVKN